MNIKNDILKPIIITISIMIFILVSIFSILHFFCPLVMSNWFYSMGNYKVSTYYMERSYKKTNNYSQCYSLINLSIKCDNYDNIIKYYQVFSDDKKYNQFVENIDSENLKSEYGKIVKSSLYSEDEYLKNKYIASLIKKDRLSDALTYAKANSNFDITIDNISNYLYNDIINGNLENIVNIDTLAKNIEKYFLDNIGIFESALDISNPEEITCIKALVIGTRINTIGQNLKNINKYDGNLIELSDEDINAKILSINSNMSKFI